MGSEVTRTTLLTLPILDGGHQLTIRELKLREDSSTIHYSITPPLPDADSAPTPDGIRTEGCLTGRPAPTPEAHVLLIRVTFVQGSRETAHDMALRIRP